MRKTNKGIYFHSPFSMFSFQDIITAVIGILILITLLMAMQLSLANPQNTDAAAERTRAELIKDISLIEAEIKGLQFKLTNIASDPGIDMTHTEYSALEERAALETRITNLRDELSRLAQNKISSEASKIEAETRLLDYEAQLEEIAHTKNETMKAKEELEDLKSSNRRIYKATDSRGRHVYLVELLDQVILVARVGQKEKPLEFTGNTSESSFLSWTRRLSASSVRFMILVHPGSTKEFSSIENSLRTRGFSVGFDLLPRTSRGISEEFGAS